MKMKNGFSNIFMLLSLTLTLSLVGLLIANLKQIVLLNQKIRLSLKNDQVSAKLAALILKINQDLDTNRFELIPRIHSNGVITYTDGTLCSTSTQNLLQPKSNSSAISTLKISSIKSLKVISHSANQFVACFVYPQQASQLDFDPQTLKGYLGITIDGFAELIGTTTANNSNNNCFDLNLNLTKSMQIPEPQITAINAIKLLIPIEENYTLYLDKLDQLRFLSHKGGSNLENQPIIKGLKQINFNLETNQAITKISAQIDFIFGIKSQFSARNSLAKNLNSSNFYNFLLNN